VLTRLLELHLQAESHYLEPRLPKDRPDVTLSWAKDQLLEMDALVGPYRLTARQGPRAHGPSTCLTAGSQLTVRLMQASWRPC